MKAVKIILYTLGVLVLILVALMFIAPTQYHIEREATIEAPRGLVFEQAVHFSNFHNWSPWSDLDPDMKTVITGIEGQVGSLYEWEGNEEAGVGSQKVVAISGDTVYIDLKFKEPFESEAQTYFIIEEVSSDPPKTMVVWGMNSSMPRPLNIMGWMMNLEKSVGKDYENGLENLKTHVESMEWMTENEPEEVEAAEEMEEETEELQQ